MTRFKVDQDKLSKILLAMITRRLGRDANFLRVQIRVQQQEVSNGPNWDAFCGASAGPNAQAFADAVIGVQALYELK